MNDTGRVSRLPTTISRPAGASERIDWSNVNAPVISITASTPRPPVARRTAAANLRSGDTITSSAPASLRRAALAGEEVTA